MKYAIIIFTFFLCVPTLKTQNLIHNGSFETYLHLPVSVSDSEYSTNQGTGISGDILTNCLCDRGINTDMIYPFQIDRYTNCFGWFNGSYPETHNQTLFTTADYFHRDVDPTDNKNWARWVDIPVNHGNSLDFSDIPLFSNYPVEPFEGDAYVGVLSKRMRDFYYNEYVAQRLDAGNPNNYMREGGKYGVSFRVKRSDSEVTTFDNLKQVSMFFWYEIPDINNEDRVIFTDTLQRNHFMVNKHNNPSGFIDDTNWVLVHDTIIAPHDLNYVFIGSFDKSRVMADINPFWDPSYISPPTTPGTNYQTTWHYIDDVRIDSVGFIDTCDCDEISNDIKFRSETRGEAGECCRVIYLKLDNQDTTCRIAEFIWDTDDGDFIFDTVNVNDLGHLQLKNNEYFPIDTICFDESRHTDKFTYDFRFRTFGSKEFSCQKLFQDSLDCYDLPCTWLNEPYPDPNDPNKQAIRLDVTYLGLNDEGKCCYELEFVNNSPFRLNANDLNFDFKDANVTNVADETVLARYNTLGEDRLSWINWGGFEPNTTWKIAHVCINPGEIEKFDWKLSNTNDDSKYDCFDERYFELGCNNCCPDFEIYKTMIEDTIDCCISIDSAYVDCGDSVQYFKVHNDVEIPVSLPYILCDDNSDLRFKVKIYDADTLYCTKFFDFNSEVENCSKCSSLHYELMKDKYYMGSGCKYKINRIYGVGDFEGSMYNYDIEYGKYVNGAYTKIDIMDYDDHDEWEFTMTSCKIDTLVFKLIKDSIVLCETEYIIQCKTCEDIEVDSLRGYEKDFYYGTPPNEIYFEGCCIDIEVMNPDSGSCDFYGLFEKGSGVRDKIDITNYQDHLLKAEKDTLTICGAYGTPAHGLIDGYFAIYDQFGNLLCTFFYEHLCDGTPFSKEVNENANIDLEQILVTGNSFEVEIGELEDLEYQIHSLEGKLIYRERLTNNRKTNLTINTADLQTGVYSLYIKSAHKQIVKIFNVVR